MSPFIVPLALFAAIVMIVKMGIEYSKWEKERDVGDFDRTLGTNELRTLIEDAVERANAPLLDRIDRLEKRLPPHVHVREQRVPERSKEEIE